MATRGGGALMTSTVCVLNDVMLLLSVGGRRGSVVHLILVIPSKSLQSVHVPAGHILVWNDFLTDVKCCHKKTFNDYDLYLFGSRLLHIVF